MLFGDGANAIGTINVDDATFSTTADLTLVGFGGTGTVNVTNGSDFTSNGILLGYGSSGTMTVAGTDTTADINGTFLVGDTGVGSLYSLRRCACRRHQCWWRYSFVVADESTSDGSSLTVTGSGSTLDYQRNGPDDPRPLRREQRRTRRRSPSRMVGF